MGIINKFLLHEKCVQSFSNKEKNLRDLCSNKHSVR